MCDKPIAGLLTGPLAPGKPDLTHHRERTHTIEQRVSPSTCAFRGCCACRGNPPQFQTRAFLGLAVRCTRAPFRVQYKSCGRKKIGHACTLQGNPSIGQRSGESIRTVRNAKIMSAISVARPNLDGLRPELSWLHRSL
jgi:hypothetical protein